VKKTALSIFVYSAEAVSQRRWSNRQERKKRFFSVRTK